METNTIVAFLLSVVGLGTAGDDGESAESRALKRSLTDMGYENVTLQSCQISFARRIKPTPSNNETFAYERYVDLNTLRGYSDAVVEKMDHVRPPHSIIASRLDDDYMYLYRRNFDPFRSWLDQAYPDANWPYDDPESWDEYSHIIEFELRQRMADLEGLTRWVSFSKHGIATDVEPNFILSYFEPAPLEKFRDAVVEYARIHDCEVDD